MITYESSQVWQVKHLIFRKSDKSILVDPRFLEIQKPWTNGSKTQGVLEVCQEILDQWFQDPRFPATLLGKS